VTLESVMMPKTCDFCVELQAPMTPDRVAWLDDRRWALMATKGPLSENHLLLVPAEHRHFSLESGVHLERVEQLVQKWSASVPGTSWIAFEHANAPVGCGVTHAHVHLLATATSVPREAIFAGMRHSHIHSLADVCGDQRELLWCAGDAFGPTVAVHAEIPSQLARRRIAEATGLGFSWDWRAYTHAAWFDANVQLARKLAGNWRA
jgi:hypothetical protein